MEGGREERWRDKAEREERGQQREGEIEGEREERKGGGSIFSPGSPSLPVWPPSSVGEKCGRWGAFLFPIKLFPKYRFYIPQEALFTSVNTLISRGLIGLSSLSRSHLFTVCEDYDSSSSLASGDHILMCDCSISSMKQCRNPMMMKTLT